MQTSHFWDFWELLTPICLYKQMKPRNNMSKDQAAYDSFRFSSSHLTSALARETRKKSIKKRYKNAMFHTHEGITT
jgi:hypothetical protein